MHGADDDLRAGERARADGGEGLIHLLMGRTPPVKAGEAVMLRTGLSLRAEAPYGRESQSARLSTPDMP